MERILFDMPLSYVDSATLLHAAKNYTNPHDWISRLVKKGELIRLKNGIYVIGCKKLQPLEQIANFLYGPSYISLEWALSYHNLIPEKTVELTSVTLGKAKHFHTQIGRFSYSHLPLYRYAIGIDFQWHSTSIGGFLIATPEKALIDFIYLRWKNLRNAEEFIESMRIESEDLAELNTERLFNIAQKYKSPSVNRFVSAL